MVVPSGTLASPPDPLAERILWFELDVEASELSHGGLTLLSVPVQTVSKPGSALAFDQRRLESGKPLPCSWLAWWWSGWQGRANGPRHPLVYGVHAEVQEQSVQISLSSSFSIRSS